MTPAEIIVAAMSEAGYPPDELFVLPSGRRYVVWANLPPLDAWNRARTITGVTPKFEASEDDWDDDTTILCLYLDPGDGTIPPSDSDEWRIVLAKIEEL